MTRLRSSKIDHAAMPKLPAEKVEPEQMTRPLPTPDAPGPDYLEYMADLIDELRSMADAMQCAKLAVVLELAHGEAKVQARSRRQSGTVVC
jgi:hypothetical protein